MAQNANEPLALCANCNTRHRPDACLLQDGNAQHFPTRVATGELLRRRDASLRGTPTRVLTVEIDARSARAGRFHTFMAAGTPADLVNMTRPGGRAAAGRPACYHNPVAGCGCMANAGGAELSVLCSHAVYYYGAQDIADVMLALGARTFDATHVIVDPARPVGSCASQGTEWWTEDDGSVWVNVVGNDRPYVHGDLDYLRDGPRAVRNSAGKTLWLCHSRIFSQVYEGGLDTVLTRFVLLAEAPRYDIPGSREYVTVPRHSPGRTLRALPRFVTDYIPIAARTWMSAKEDLRVPRALVDLLVVELAAVARRGAVYTTATRRCTAVLTRHLSGGHVPDARTARYLASHGAAIIAAALCQVENSVLTSWAAADSGSRAMLDQSGLMEALPEVSDHYVARFGLLAVAGSAMGFGLWLAKRRLSPHSTGTQGISMTLGHLVSAPVREEYARWLITSKALRLTYSLAQVGFELMETVQAGVPLTTPIVCGKLICLVPAALLPNRTLAITWHALWNGYVQWQTGMVLPAAVPTMIGLSAGLTAAQWAGSALATRWPNGGSVVHALSFAYANLLSMVSTRVAAAAAGGTRQQSGSPPPLSEAAAEEAAAPGPPLKATTVTYDTHLGMEERAADAYVRAVLPSPDYIVQSRTLSLEEGLRGADRSGGRWPTRADELVGWSATASHPGVGLSWRLGVNGMEDRRPGGARKVGPTLSGTPLLYTASTANVLPALRQRLAQRVRPDTPLERRLWEIRAMLCHDSVTELGRMGAYDRSREEEEEYLSTPAFGGLKRMRLRLALPAADALTGHTTGTLKIIVKSEVLITPPRGEMKTKPRLVAAQGYAGQMASGPLTRELTKRIKKLGSPGNLWVRSWAVYVCTPGGPTVAALAAADALGLNFAVPCDVSKFEASWNERDWTEFHIAAATLQDRRVFAGMGPGFSARFGEHLLFFSTYALGSGLGATSAAGIYKCVHLLVACCLYLGLRPHQDFLILNSSDDSLVRLRTRAQAEAFDALLREGDFTNTLWTTGGVVTAADGVFCSQYMYRANGATYLGPRVCSLLAKLFWSRSPNLNPLGQARRARSIALGALAQYASIPVLRVVLRRVLELTRHLSAKPELPTYSASTAFEAGPETLEVFAARYRLDVVEVLDLEAWIEAELNTLRCTLYHPTLASMRAVEEE